MYVTNSTVTPQKRLQAGHCKLANANKPPTLLKLIYWHRNILIMRIGGPGRELPAEEGELWPTVRKREDQRER